MVAKGISRIPRVSWITKVKAYLEIFESSRTFALEAMNQFHHTRVLCRNAVGDRSSDADNFLKHFDIGIFSVVAGFYLTDVHAEACVHVHTLGAVTDLAYRERLVFQLVILPIWYSGDVLCEVRNPFCSLECDSCMVYQTAVHDL